MKSSVKLPPSFTPLFALALITLYFNTAYLDPFNLPKTQLLIFFGLLGFLAIFQMLLEGKIDIPSKILGLIISLLACLHILSSISNTQGAWQTLMGTYQRNLGLLSYLAFGVIAIWISLLRNEKLSLKGMYLLVVTGSIETFYGLIQLSGKDFISWNNPYSPIIGTFGNPNFMSAFLGLSAASAILMVIIDRALTLGLRTLLLFQTTCSIYLCLSSNSVQGLFVFLVALSTAYAIYLIQFRLIKILIPYLFFMGLSVSLISLGLLKIGPFAKYLYQNSISARGDYWRAAWKATLDKPLFGTGVDNYGEAFLLYRDITQVQGRGFGTYSNNAHNVFLQFSSTLGILGLALLVLLISYTIILSVRNLKSTKGKDLQVQIAILGLFVSMLPVMLISIDNIGFTIWFWAFIGLIASKASEKNVSIKSQKHKIVGKNILIAKLTLGLIIAFTLQQITLADTKMRNIYKEEESINQVSDLLNRYESIPSISKNEIRYKTLISSAAYSKGWYEESLKLAKEATSINSKYIDAWRMRAISEEALGMGTALIESREQIVKLDPLRLDNLLELMRGYLKIGMTEDARLVLKSMQKISPHDQITTAAYKEFMDNSKN